MDEIFLEALVGVDRRCKASGLCTTCCPKQFSLQSEAEIDVFALWLESNDNVHLGEYGTVMSIAAHDYDHYRVIPLWEVLCMAGRGIVVQASVGARGMRCRAGQATFGL